MTGRLQLISTEKQKRGPQSVEEPYRLSFFFSPSFVATSGRGTSLGLTRSLFPLLLPFRSRRSSAGGRGSLAAIRRSSCPVSFLARLARSSSSSSSSSSASSASSFAPRVLDNFKGENDDKKREKKNGKRDVRHQLFLCRRRRPKPVLSHCTDR